MVQTSGGHTPADSSGRVAQRYKLRERNHTMLLACYFGNHPVDGAIRPPTGRSSTVWVHLSPVGTAP
jgi:hypothetical protein